MRYALLLSASLIALSTPVALAGSLNKCIDANGQVTYSNLPCKQAQETRKLAIDPPPVPDPVRPTPRPASASPAPVAKSAETSVSTTLETRRSKQVSSQPSASKCNTLSDKLGRIVDKMDTARRQGYTQPQMDEWNQAVRDLERQKQQAGCF